MDGGEEAINDEAELAQVRRQARRVYLKSAVAAVALTALSVIIP